jgi:Ca2+-transporting ATPase
MAMASIFVQAWAARQGYNVPAQQTAVFTTLCLVQLGNALSVRSFYHSLFASDLFSNRGMWGAIALTVILQILIIYVPFLQPVFKTVALDLQIITVILVVLALSILLIELLKYLTRKRYLK